MKKVIIIVALIILNACENEEIEFEPRAPFVIAIETYKDSTDRYTVLSGISSMGSGRSAGNRMHRSTFIAKRGLFKIYDEIQVVPFNPNYNK